ncbi:hypothetical protein HPB47_027960 [Ixodes persulcatus]|uniref:Uncharacterized protein n=1 Tax=Ixodes persulcatus TaxID=34615 RepID=A0AC60PUL1_IXOPE|nr:hypothetical protein HPB47_027960 [Ixodes persulcatus]
MPSPPRRSASSGAADVPAARLNYRYAGLERFSGRPRVYENPPADAPPPLPERQAPVTPPSSQLSFKREMFFRESPAASSTVGVPTAVAAATLGTGLASPSAPKEEGTSPYATNGRSQAEGCVGFASLPNQVYRKAVKKGFEFTLMVVGESGLGKSTLLNSMFLTDVYSNEYPGPSQRVQKTVQVETTRVVLREGSVHLCLTVVDTPGFGDAVDNSQCWQPVADYVKAQFAGYLDAESRVHRSALSDGRVHCCLYFIAPSGHGGKYGEQSEHAAKRLTGLVFLGLLAAEAGQLKDLDAAIMLTVTIRGGSDVGGSPEGRTRPSHNPEGCAFGKSPEKDEGKPPTREYGFALASGTRPHVATSHGLPELGLDRDAGEHVVPTLPPP